MRFFHLVATLAYGDAVSNDVRALNAILVEMGFYSRIYAVRTSANLVDSFVHSIDEVPETDDDDIIIYHLAIGDDLTDAFAKMHGKKLMVYHNITPPEFFAGYSRQAFELTQRGYSQVRMLADKVDYCIADSEYNKSELISMGYKCPIDVVPILIPFEDYAQKPSKQTLLRYADAYTNIIFVGRIAPNKRQEEVAAAFAAYKKNYNPKARLFLVGSYDPNDGYYKDLKKYIEKLGVNDIIMPGHIKFDEILAYYHLADLFLSMSDHEGFCVPLVEAMYFNVPVAAKDTTAISGTLGGSGVLLPNSDPALAAAAINRVLTDSALKQHLLEGEQKRLAQFSYDIVKQQFKETFNKFLSYVGAKL